MVRNLNGKLEMVSHTRILSRNLRLRWSTQLGIDHAAILRNRVSRYIPEYLLAAVHHYVRETVRVWSSSLKTVIPIWGNRGVNIIPNKNYWLRSIRRGQLIVYHLTGGLGAPSGGPVKAFEDDQPGTRCGAGRLRSNRGNER